MFSLASPPISIIPRGCLTIIFLEVTVGSRRDPYSCHDALCAGSCACTGSGTHPSAKQRNRQHPRQRRRAELQSTQCFLTLVNWLRSCRSNPPRTTSIVEDPGILGSSKRTVVALHAIELSQGRLSTSWTRRPHLGHSAGLQGESWSVAYNDNVGQRSHRTSSGSPRSSPILRRVGIGHQN